MTQNIINSLEKLEKLGIETSLLDGKMRETCFEISKKIVEAVKCIMDEDIYELPREYTVIRYLTDSGYLYFLKGKISHITSTAESFSVDYTKIKHDKYTNSITFDCSQEIEIEGTKIEQLYQFAKDIMEGLLDEIIQCIELEKKERDTWIVKLEPEEEI